MLAKIAAGNVRRSMRDYSVFFLTLAAAACLLYSFTASGDYLAALDLTEEQRVLYVRTGDVMRAFSLFAVIVFAFLVTYATRFIARRRKREFGLYALLGMGKGRVSAILALEGALVGACSLAAGVATGVLASPAFGAAAAFSFGVPWRFALVFSPGAAAWTAGCFAAIVAAATLLTVRDVARQPLAKLMDAQRAPERLALSSRGATRLQLALAAALLAAVWGSCLLAPVTFILFIVPLGFAAVGATYLAFRVLAARVPARLRRRPERYLRGLRPFVVRQLEGKASSGSAALACVCVLLAAAVCLLCAGFSLGAGMRGSGVQAGGGAALAPIGFAGVFYGATFLVAAAAVLALQQLSEAADGRERFRLLGDMGASGEMMHAAVRAQVGVCFAAPVAGALVHNAFGLALVGFVVTTLGSATFPMTAMAVAAFAVGVMAAYYALTVRACARMLVPACA